MQPLPAITLNDVSLLRNKLNLHPIHHHQCMKINSDPLFIRGEGIESCGGVAQPLRLSDLLTRPSVMADKRRTTPSLTPVTAQLPKHHKTKGLKKNNSSDRAASGGIIGAQLLKDAGLIPLNMVSRHLHSLT